MSKSDVLFKVGYYANKLKPDVKINFYLHTFDTERKLKFIAYLDAGAAINVPYYVMDYWFDEEAFNILLG